MIRGAINGLGITAWAVGMVWAVWNRNVQVLIYLGIWAAGWSTGLLLSGTPDD